MKRRYDRYSLNLKELVFLILQAAALSLALNYLFFRSFFGLLLIFPVGWVYIRQQKKRKLKNLRRCLHYHFKDMVASLHTALRTGYSLENAIKEAYLDLLHTYGKSDIMVQELYLMCNQLQVKVSPEDLFADLGRRSRIEDIEDFAQVIQIAKRTGGNLDQVLQDLWRTLSEKIDTQQDINAQIAAKKYEQTVMSIMPAGIILYLQLSFPSLLQDMYITSTGKIVMGFCLILYGAAYLIGIKIVDIEI